MRKSWDNYFLDIAKQVSSRSTCDRASVGCVIVRDNTILCTGYNGSMRGAAHCDDVGHLMENNHCIATVHAEANAITQAAKNGIKIDNSVAYITHEPCWNCFKLLINAGIKKIFYSIEYTNDQKIVDHAKILGIVVKKIG